MDGSFESPRETRKLQGAKWWLPNGDNIKFDLDNALVMAGRA